MDACIRKRVVYDMSCKRFQFFVNVEALAGTAKSDGIAHPMNLRTQYHKTVSWNCKRSVALLLTNEENILPYTVKIDSARAVTTFSQNF